MGFDSPNSFVFLSLPVIIYAESIPLFEIYTRGFQMVHDVNSACLQHMFYKTIYEKLKPNSQCSTWAASLKNPGDLIRNYSTNASQKNIKIPGDSFCASE